MKFSFQESSQAIDLTPGGSSKSYRATMGEQTFEIELIGVKDGKLDLLVDGRHVIAYVSSDQAKRWVTIDGQTAVLTKPRTGAQRRGSGQEHASALAAPMPGQVRAVNVAEGEAVAKGKTLMVLEAMKMEIRIQAPRDAKVRKLLVAQGQTVEREQILIEIEDD